MPEPTKEQIEAAKNAIRDSDRLGDCYVILHDAETLLSALESAERKTAALLKTCGEALKATQSIAPEFSILGAVRAKFALAALKDAGVHV